MTALYLHNLAHKKNDHQNSAALIATSRTPVLHQQLAANGQAMNCDDQPCLSIADRTRKC
jgi:hypothetical protein